MQDLILEWKLQQPVRSSFNYDEPWESQLIGLHRPEVIFTTAIAKRSSMSVSREFKYVT